jgi:hypothetical protein
MTLLNRYFWLKIKLYNSESEMPFSEHYRMFDDGFRLGRLVVRAHRRKASNEQH